MRFPITSAVDCCTRAYSLMSVHVTVAEQLSNQHRGKQPDWVRSIKIDLLTTWAFSFFFSGGGGQARRKMCGRALRERNAPSKVMFCREDLEKRKVFCFGTSA